MIYLILRPERNQQTLHIMESSKLREKLKGIFLEQIANESWMTSEDRDYLIEESVKVVGGWEKLEQAVATGVSNGYSEDFQLRLFSSLLHELNESGLSQ